jgi:hypothetical protein
MEYNFNSEEAKELMFTLPLPIYTKFKYGEEYSIDGHGKKEWVNTFPYRIEIIKEPSGCGTVIENRKCGCITCYGMYRLKRNEDKHPGYIESIEFKSDGANAEEVIEDLKKLLTTIF